MIVDERYTEEIAVGENTVRVFKENWFLMEHSNRGRNDERIAQAEAHCLEREHERQIERESIRSPIPVTLGGCIVTEPIDMDNHRGVDLIQHIKDCGVGALDEGGFVDAVLEWTYKMGERDMLSNNVVEPLTEEELHAFENWGLNIYVTGLTPVLMTLLQGLMCGDVRWEYDVTFWNWCNDTGYYPIILAV